MERPVEIDFITVRQSKEIVVELNWDRECIEEIRLRTTENDFIKAEQSFVREDLQLENRAESIFRFSIKKRNEFYVETRIDGAWEKCSLLQYGAFSPVGIETKNGFYHRGGILIQAKENGIIILKCSRLHSMKYKFFLFFEFLAFSNASRKALFVRYISNFIKYCNKADIWILHDRFDKGDDNGEAFWRWLQENRKKTVKAYFVVENNSPCHRRLKKERHILIKDSLKYRVLLFASRCVVESAGYSELRNFTNFYRDLSANIKYVFLQHGVIYNNIAPFMSRYERNFSYIVTSAEREQKHIAETPGYYHPLKNVWLTGLPRFDFLYHDEQKIITVMPSWRAYLKGLNLDEFKNSVYYQMWRNLLEDDVLKVFLIHHGYRLQIKLHPNMQDYADAFRSDSYLVADETATYRKVFAESNLIITDYSSAVFDFLYLRKPVAYYQFDKNEFYGGTHTTQKGYLDLEKDGFGEVVLEHNEIIKLISEYVETGCTMKNLFRQRVDSFFAYNDSKSCERLYNKLIELQLGEI